MYLELPPAGEASESQSLQRRLYRTTVAALVVLLAACTTAPRSSPSTDGQTDRLEGTWVITIIPPPIANVPAHKGLISFVRGGVALGEPDSTLPSFVAPIVRTASQQGSWEQVGPQEFVWTFSSLGYDATGAPIGFLKLSGRLRLTDKDTSRG